MNFFLKTVIVTSNYLNTINTSTPKFFKKIQKWRLLFFCFQIRHGGLEGPYTKEAGFLAYYEICSELERGGWDLRRDEMGGPYMVKGDQWVGFDDPQYITQKVCEKELSNIIRVSTNSLMLLEPISILKRFPDLTHIFCFEKDKSMLHYSIHSRCNFHDPPWLIITWTKCLVNLLPFF